MCLFLQITQGEMDSDLTINTGNFGRVPPELFQNILRFLSSEDLSTCTSVCRFLRKAASDEGLWRRLYCLRWGRPPSSDRRGKLRGCTWKKLYFEVVLHQCLFCILTRLYLIRRTFVICQVLPPVGLIAFIQWMSHCAKHLRAYLFDSGVRR
jgi:hypothetical protein